MWKCDVRRKACSEGQKAKSKRQRTEGRRQKGEVVSEEWKACSKGRMQSSEANVLKAECEGEAITKGWKA